MDCIVTGMASAHTLFRKLSVFFIPHLPVRFLLL